MDQPTITVLLCTYNRRSTLEKSINSVFQQSLKSCKLLIINDCSTDDTSEYLETISDDPRVLIIHNEQNQGLQASLRKGMNMISTPLVARLDDDDNWIDQDKLSKQLKMMTNSPELVLLGTSYSVVDQVYHNPKTDQDIRKQMSFRCPFRHSTVVFRRDAYLQTKGYDASVPYLEDWLLWIEMGQHGTMANLPDVTTQIAEDDNLSQSFFLRQHELVKEKVIPKIGPYPRATLAKIYHYGVFYFFRIIPLDSWLHRLAQRMFSIVFSLKKSD